MTPLVYWLCGSDNNASHVIAIKCTFTMKMSGVAGFKQVIMVYILWYGISKLQQHVVAFFPGMCLKMFWKVVYGMFVGLSIHPVRCTSYYGFKPRYCSCFIKKWWMNTGRGILLSILTKCIHIKYQFNIQMQYTNSTVPAFKPLPLVLFGWKQNQDFISNSTE